MRSLRNKRKDCEVCGEPYDVVVGTGVTPETKSGVLYDHRPPLIDGEFSIDNLRFFCSTECGAKLAADIGGIDLLSARIEFEAEQQAQNQMVERLRDAS